MRALVALIISGILKKFTSLLRLQPPHMFMCVPAISSTKTLSHHPSIIWWSADAKAINNYWLLASFGEVQRYGQGWESGISLWWYRSLASPGQSPGHWFRPSWPPARAPGGTGGNFQLGGSKLVIDVPHNSKTPISRQSIHLINSRLFQMTTFKFRFSKLKNQCKVYAGKNCPKGKTQKMFVLILL